MAWALWLTLLQLARGQGGQHRAAASHVCCPDCWQRCEYFRHLDLYVCPHCQLAMTGDFIADLAELVQQ